MNKKVIIIGAGGHAKVIADICLLNGDSIVGFLDDVKPDGLFLNFQKLGKVEQYVNYADCEFVVAIGDSFVRERYVNQLKGVTWYTAVHPKAVISAIDTFIGEGTVVMANAVINPGAKVGKHCIINTSSVIEHDNIIGDYVHISVGAKLAGKVEVCNNTWIGVGATVKDTIKIEGKCFIGAGAVVVKNITESGTYVGVPAKLLKKESVDNE